MRNSSDQDAQAKNDSSSTQASKSHCLKTPMPNAKTVKAMKELEAGKGQRFNLKELDAPKDSQITTRLRQQHPSVCLRKTQDIKDQQYAGFFVYPALDSVFSGFFSIHLG